MIVSNVAAKTSRKTENGGLVNKPSIRYMTLSSFVRPRPVRTRTEDLEQRLRTQYGAEKIESLKLPNPRPAQGKKHASETAPPFLSSIQALSEQISTLKESAIDVIVIDQEAELPQSLLSAACQHLKNLMASGIDVGIFFSDSNLILLREISRLTTSDEFIRIYLKEIWKPL